VDHGKSALVQVLTGIDPDRLAEEKRRGITIDLGFADLDLGGGKVVSFVDVPGHERFVRHMVAGATGIDAVLFVVAADEGVRPQTREHLAICRLLAVGAGIVALSKCDLIEPELAEVVALELAELLSGTFLQDAPIVPVSSRTGQGLDRLVREIGELYERVPPRRAEGVPRLAIDRSFVLKGFGTVVTGSLVSGSLSEGAEVEVLPEGRRGRIRGLQIHGNKVQTVPAGCRTAVNLQGLDREDAPRGATLTAPGALGTTRRIWARVTLLARAPERLRRGGTLRFHQGTCERTARLRVLGTLDADTLSAELVLSEPTVLAPGDRFILRRPAPVDTVGGGVVVDVRPPSARRVAPEAFEPAALEPDRALLLRLARRGDAGAETWRLGAELGWTREECEVRAAELVRRGSLTLAGGRLFDRSAWDGAVERTRTLVARHHRDQPLAAGIPREVLHREACRAMPQESWREFLAELERAGAVRLSGDLVARSDHEVTLGAEDQRLARLIGERFRAAGLDPPALQAVVPEADLPRAAQIVEWLVTRGELVRVPSQRLFHGEALAALREKLRAHARRSRTIDVATFKELAGVTRKNAIPLLEHFDGERVTRRIGDRREILL
jgi:selenocysteine-specific elongation factor